MIRLRLNWQFNFQLICSLAVISLHEFPKCYFFLSGWRHSISTVKFSISSYFSIFEISLILFARSLMTLLSLIVLSKLEQFDETIISVNNLFIVSYHCYTFWKRFENFKPSVEGIFIRFSTKKRHFGELLSSISDHAINYDWVKNFY